MELWVMGPPCGLKEGKALFILNGHDSKACQRVACQLCRQQSSVPRARDEKNHSPARWMRRTNRQSSRPSVATGKSSTIVTGSYWQLVHRGVYISREIILLISYRSPERSNKPMERKNVIIRLSRTMERKNVFKHIFQGYNLPKDKQSMISMTG